MTFLLYYTHMVRLVLVSCWIIALAGCQPRTNNTVFEKVENSGIVFTNALENNKDFNIFSYRNFYNGAGVAIGDINNDGLADVFMTANMGQNKLFLNKGGFQFEDISDKAGFKPKQQWSTGVVMVDINADGLLDIYVCNAGYQKGVALGNELWINKGDLRFEEQARVHNLAFDDFTTHAAFFDYDLDGDLDCYILNNSFIPVNTLNYSNKRDLRARDWPVADFLKGGGDRLMRNDGGRFTDVSDTAGIYGSLIGFGLGVTVGDVNDDGYPDIYVSNDFFERDYLYINQRDGRFREELEQRIAHLSHSSMGADMADINNDLHPDIFVTEMLPDDDYRLKTTTTFEYVDVQRFKVNSGFYYQFMQNTLQLNNGQGRFREIAHYSGVAASDWSWGALIFDADNDGLNDIYVSNGINNDVTDQDFIDFFANDVIQRMVMTGRKEQIDEIISRMPSVPLQNKMYRNSGHLKFTDKASDWGMSDKTFSNGAAYGDLDNDGDLDLVVSNVNQPALVYRNNSGAISGNHFLRVKLQSPAPNTRAVGSKVYVYADSLKLMREMMPSRGFQSSVDPVLQFGLGKSTRVDSVVIRWPDLRLTVLRNPGMDTLLVVDAAKSTITIPDDPSHIPLVKPLLLNVPARMDSCLEDDYVDFYVERNIPQMLSREGPAAAQADVNGDGLADLYVSGTLKTPGRLYLNSPMGYRKGGSFTPALTDVEDISVLFVDIDQDGDQDLFLGAGGNHQPSNTGAMQNRLYLNDGKGNFTRTQTPLPTNMGNNSVLLGFDLEGDGDTDIFAASRSMPANYGVAPRMIVYVNDGKGGLSALPQASMGPLYEAGMVTGAVFADIDPAPGQELVLVGDWMAPRIFSHRGGRFTEIDNNLSRYKGWWQAVRAADLDGDGDLDLVLGNLGENFYLHPDSTHPVKLWINAFSRTMLPEKIITRRIAGKDMPVFLKRDLTDQIPTMKKENLRHADFAQRSIQELFDKELIDKSQVRELNYTSSVIAWNEGKGQFSVQRLPDEVQFSSVNAIAVTDLDGDARPDLLLGGNLLYWLPQFSRLDASEGAVLLNRGSRNWQLLTPSASGLSVPGAIRHILPITDARGPAWLFLRNNSTPLVYRRNTP
jgi:hypothetical protein